jgi:uracil-DNA glycosylase
MNKYTNKDVLFADVSPEWRELLDNELLNEVLEKLADEKDSNIVPPATQVFEFAKLTPLDKIKIVTIGQYPYSKAGLGHGLAFSCLSCVPGPLRNIYKCLEKHKWIESVPKSGDLTYWATQGILLVNGALTTEVGNTNAHKNIWSEYTDKLFADLSAHSVKFPVTTVSGTVKIIKHYPIFMLWGNYAKKKAVLFDERATVLTYSHPSPLAQSHVSFLDCDHFTVANNKLKDIGTIDWNIPEPLSKVDKRFGMNENKVVAFTDGSCYPNKICPEAVAGYAAIFSLGAFKDVAIYGNIENRPHHASNQRAEGIAIYQVLMYLENHMNEWEECIIVTDSDFWIKMITVYMPGWELKDLDFKERKNPDLTFPLWNLFKTLSFEFDKTIEFRHVRSHDKSGWSKFPVDGYEYFCYFNNSYVDELAGYARKALNPGTHKIDDVEYAE